jgi:hypothetical protein
MRRSDDNLNSNSETPGVDIANLNTDGSAICGSKSSDVVDDKPKLSKTVVFNTQPVTERVKFDWKIKNFEAICPRDCSGFQPCRSNVFTVGTKLGKPSRWCFELRHDNGYLSMVLCREKIYVNLNESPHESNIPCKIALISPDGTASLEGITGPNPTQIHEDVLARVQSVVEKVGGFAHPRENSEWKQFISIHELHDNRTRYFRVDGTIHFKMEFEISGLTHMKSSEESALERRETLRKEAMERHRKQIAADLEQLMTTGECSNFVIRCGTQVFSVHKQLLQARCPKFFEDLLELMHASKIRVCKSTDPLLSKIVKITDVEPEPLSAFLEYIYTGTVKQLPDVFSKWQLLLQLADRWKASNLKDFCFYKMLAILDAENTGPFVCLANVHEAGGEVWEFISAFCELNYHTLIKNESFNKCRLDNPHSFRFFDTLRRPALSPYSPKS